MIVVEQVNRVFKAVSRVLEVLVNQDLNVKLFISPIDFKQRLEIGNKLSKFSKCFNKDIPYYFWMVGVKFILLNPFFWVKLC